MATNADVSVKIVTHDIDKTASATGEQLWLLISTSQSRYVFYALEEARVTSDGSGGGGAFETHFMTPAQYGTAQAGGLDFSTVADVGYSDPVNSVPDTVEATQPIANGTTVINDVDYVFSHSTGILFGTTEDDLIAADFNDDTVEAGAGNDLILGWVWS